MKNYIIIIIGLLSCLDLCGQEIRERLILSDNEDSLFLKSNNINFDIDGNYCFVIRKEEKEYWVTKKDTIDGFGYIGSRFGNGGEISDTKSYSDPDDKPYYYKNAKGIKIYGTAVGKIKDYQTSNTKENIELLTTLNDSAYYYINGKLLLKKYKDNSKYYGTENDWAAFSENGNIIYTLKPDSINYLFVNDKIIDSSKYEYTQLAINNNGNYIYAEGKKPDKPIGKYDYMFFIHSMDRVLGFARTVWDYELKENGAYYYSGDDNGLTYIAIDDKLYKNIKTISNITLIDKNTYLYAFVEKNKNKINVNGHNYTYNFDEILLPTVDKASNFAFYGLKNYYVYKFINGQQSKKPLSKYGVRATPLYISPKGESLHYFKTEDSIYLYHDEKLIFKPIQKDSIFLVKSPKDFFPFDYSREDIDNGDSFFYLEYDKQGYFVYNGKFSNPILPIKNSSFSDEKRTGEIVIGTVIDEGFFIIQKLENNKYLIIINNEVYKELEGVDKIISDSYFFDGKNLTFYGIKGDSFYQFKLSL